MPSIHDRIADAYQADRVNYRFDNMRTKSLADLLLTRSDWPRLQLMLNEHGNWDIVIRVDGGYADFDDAQRVLRSYAIDAARSVFGLAQVPYEIEVEDQDAA